MDPYKVGTGRRSRKKRLLMRLVVALGLVFGGAGLATSGDYGLGEFLVFAGAILDASVFLSILRSGLRAFWRGGTRGHDADALRGAEIVDADDLTERLNNGDRK